jgi:hypothetical protein
LWIPCLIAKSCARCYTNYGWHMNAYDEP